VSEPFRPRLGRVPANRRALLSAGCVAACALMLAGSPLVPASAVRPAPPWRSRHTLPGLDQRAAAAERSMREAEAVVREAKAVAGVAAEAGVDRSGLVGSELTPLVTTLGSLEAKRTAVNPRWASVLTRQLAAAGIGPGDVIAAGFSGSFPGLNLAVMAAAHALGADLIAITSVTASTWGANQPGFTWPEIECRIVVSGLLPRASIAVTAGGDGDTAQDLDLDGRRLAAGIRDASARRLGVPALRPADLRDAIRQRLSAYRRAAGGRPIALYVNVGGTAASLGQSTAVLHLQSGFIPARPFDRSDDGGVMARLAAQGVRILTLLNVRDLALRWGIPLGDPAP
jgi:poly-gamma-glutamate system protein